MYYLLHILSSTIYIFICLNVDYFKMESTFLIYKTYLQIKFYVIHIITMIQTYFLSHTYSYIIGNFLTEHISIYYVYKRYI